MAFPKIVLSLMVVALATGTTFADQCRTEGLRVGGTVVGDEYDYVYDIVTEADCVNICNNNDECNAVNWYPDYQACLMQKESLLTHKDQLSTIEDPLTVYIIVKGCTGQEQPETKPVEPESEPQPNPPLSELEPEQQERFKRQAVDCRQEGVLVGGSPLGSYTFNVTEDQCFDMCAENDECKAFNYFPEHQEACLLQGDSLASVPGLETVQFNQTVYVIVKGCSGQVGDWTPPPASDVVFGSA